MNPVSCVGAAEAEARGSASLSPGAEHRQIPNAPSGTKTFLFLQGGATPFFLALGRALVSAGHRVYRVNFCSGDELFWRDLPAWNFRFDIDRLPAFLEEKIRDCGISDLVVFGDCRPCHRKAIDLARQFEIRIHVFEEGYLRPNWITLERDGVNGYSRLSRDAKDYLDLATKVPGFAAPAGIPGGMLRRACYDIVYHLANFFGARRFPGYRNHRPESAPAEYIGWFRRFSVWPFTRILQRSLHRRIQSQGLGYFLLPLQLSGDSQIQVHSRFESMCEAIDFVLGSFARSAADGNYLVVKRHPLDTGTVSYGREIRKLAEQYGVSQRVFFIEGGDLSAWIQNARGVVTVNSTVGLAALMMGCPLIALGEAVYNISGLSFSGSLEQFWRSPEKPDAQLKDAFLKVCVHLTQLPGNYYSPEGISAAVARAAARLGGAEATSGAGRTFRSAPPARELAADGSSGSAG